MLYISLHTSTSTFPRAGLGREASPILVLANMKSMQQPDGKPACAYRQCCFSSARSAVLQLTPDRLPAIC